MKDYLIITVCCLVVFILVERYKKNILAFSKKHFRLSTKIPRNKISKIFVVWVFILVLRKLIYMPLVGVIQTKNSVWWVREDILIFQTYILLLFLFGLFMLGTAIGFFATPTESFGCLFFVYPILVFVFGIPGIVRLLEELKIGYIPVEQILITPLLFLKMLCSGKYLGILTSLAVAFFILDRYKKMKLKINRRNLKYLKVPGIIIVIFLFICFSIFTGDWQDRFVQKCQSAKTQSDYEELLGAAQSIRGDIDKSNTLKILALKIAERGNIPWATEIGRIIPNEGIKAITLKEIREKIEKK